MNESSFYRRKSTESKERQVASLDDQLKAVKETATKYDLRVIADFSESKSAKKPGVRTEFYRMLDLIRSGKADSIVCWDASRLSRNAKDGGELIYLIDNHSLKIYTPYTVYDSSNSFLLFIEFGMATDFSKKLSHNVRRGLESRVVRGLYPGPAPIGYLNTRDTNGRSVGIEPDTERFTLVRKWWDLILSGQYSVESSLRQIGEMGLKDKNSKVISRTAAYRLFRSEFYVGNFKFRGEIHKGIHEPMISKEEFDRVQQMLDGKRKIQTTTSLPLMGFIRCSCGATITGEKHVKHYKNGTSQTFYYYRCTKKHGECIEKKYISPTELENQAIEYIKRLELHPLYIEWVKGVLKRQGREEFEADRKLKELQAKRLLEISHRKEVVWGMKVDGLIDQAEYDLRKRALLREELNLKTSISSKRLDYWDKVTDQALDFAGSMLSLFKQDDPQLKRLVLQTLGSNLMLKNGKLLIEAKSAFIFFKNNQNKVFSENGWLEPGPDGRKEPIQGDNQMQYRLEVPLGEATGTRTQNPQLKRLVLYL